MKSLFYLILITFYIAAASQTSYGVYLEYEDSVDGRVIRVDFRDLDDVYSNPKDAQREGGRRIAKMLAKEALSFTEKTTIRTSSRGMFTYTSREKDFFTSSRAHTFIEWIESCAELGKLEFLGVDDDYQVASVTQAFLRLIDHHKSTLEEDFILVEAKDFLAEDKSAWPLERMDSSVSLKTDLIPKFRKVLIRCTGKRVESVKEGICGLFRINESLMKNFVIEE